MTKNKKNGVAFAAVLLAACGSGSDSVVSDQATPTAVSATPAAATPTPTPTPVNPPAQATSPSPSPAPVSSPAAVPAPTAQTPPAPAARPVTPTTTIMFIGDSITRGSDEFANAGKTFRGRIYSLLTQAGNLVNFLGSQTLTPSIGGDPDHEGYNGATIQDTTSRIARMLPASVNPDIIVLTIGYNDIWGVRQGIPQRYDYLISELRAAKPNATLILCTLYPTRGESEAQFRLSVPASGDLNDRIRVTANASTADRIHLADIAAVPFEAADYFDGLHLSQAGADKFAQVLYRVLSRNLRQASITPENP